MPVLTLPMALIGLAAVPALAAIYWLRNRSRRHTVSSLMLWAEQRRSRAGGRRLQRMQTPLLLLLEVLTAALLVAAAAGPRVRSDRARRPLVVVLDDSYSMLAGLGADSARQRAAAAVQGEIRGTIHHPVQFVLAGASPGLLGGQADTPAQAAATLARWRPSAPAADLDRAAALAASVGGPRARILIVTDHPPAAPLEEGRIQWWAFGRALPNLAVVNAVRSCRDGADRCLIEVANLSAAVHPAVAVIEGGSGGMVGTAGETGPPTAVLPLGPGETRRMLIRPAAADAAVRASLPADALEIDNQAVLLPSPPRLVRVRLDVADVELRDLLHRALAAAGLGPRGAALVTDSRPQVVFTDSASGEPGAAGGAWVVRLLAEKDAAAFAGPFIVDRNHPLTDGLALDGVIWGGGQAAPLPGTPVITAGNVPLLTDQQRPAGRRELRLRLVPKLSTLHESPNWPILWWNLLNWRASEAEGLRATNVRLGAEVHLTLPGSPEAVSLRGPDGKERRLAPTGRGVVVAAEAVGLHTILADRQEYAFAANALSREESDLSGCASGRWGQWVTREALRTEFTSVAWALVLAALAALTAHALLVGRGEAGGDGR